MAEALELANAVIDVNDEVAGLELGEIGEKAGSTDFTAGAVDGRGDLEKIGVAKHRKLCVRKRNAVGEWRANKEQRGGFERAFRGKTRGGVFRFAKNVRKFVFAADVRKAFELAGAGRGKQNLAATASCDLTSPMHATTSP